MGAEEEKQKTKIEKMIPLIRRGTYIIVEAKLQCHYQSIQAVFNQKRFYNEEMVKLVDRINKLSDEDFAVELVRAKKKLQQAKKK